MMIAVTLWLLVVGVLAVLWSRSIGIARAFVAGLCRAGWTLPLIVSLFPETVTKRIPGTVALQPVHILVDDSDSMGLPDPAGGTARARVTDLLRRVDDVCIQFGCMPKVTNLSEIAADTKKGFSP